MAKDYIADAVNSEKQFSRVPVGNGAREFTNASGAPERGFLRPKGSTTVDSDLTGGAGTKARGNVDQDGAAHTIKAVRAPQVQEAQATQANGRIVPPSHRGGKNFWSQA